MSAPVSSSTKSNKKKKSLALLLTKKKKVGCLSSPANGSVDILPGNNNPESTDDDQDESKHTGSNPESSSDNTNTNVALCCMMTESSQTPLHNCRLKNESQNSNLNKQNILQRIGGYMSADENVSPNGLPPLVKPTSEDNIVISPSEPASVNKKKKSHKRSFSLSRGLFGSGDKTTDKQDCKSPESSPSLQVGKGRWLLTRRSVDNIAVSAGSSPASTRSHPEGRKGKSRPSSVVVLSRRDGESAASTDSLARQSLLAAQVLHLIPAHKARER